jgi:hypothetical protein
MSFVTHWVTKDMDPPRRQARSDLRGSPVREKPHLARVVDEDAGNVTLSGPLRPFPDPGSGPGNARH